MKVLTNATRSARQGASFTLRNANAPDLALFEALLRHGTEPNVEQAEWEDGRFGHTALYDAQKDRRAFIALLDAGAGPDVLVSDFEYGVRPLRDSLAGPMRALAEAWYPQQHAATVAGVWELAAMQRAPGGLEDEDALAEQQDRENSECTVGFADVAGRLELREEQRALLVPDGTEYHGLWVPASGDRGFVWRSLEGDNSEDDGYIAGLGMARPAGLEGAPSYGYVLPLWIGDLRYHFRRPRTFRRWAIRRRPS